MDKVRVYGGISGFRVKYGIKLGDCSVVVVFNRGIDKFRVIFLSRDGLRKND